MDAIIYSPGALQAYGHAFDYTSGLAGGLAEHGFDVHLISHQGPLRESHPVTDVRSPAPPSSQSLIGRLPGKMSRPILRLAAEPRLLRTLVALAARYPTAPIVFETFEYLSLSRYIGRFRARSTACIFHSTTFRSETQGGVRTLYKRVSARAARRIAEGVTVAYVHGVAMRANLIDQLSLADAGKVSVLPYGAPSPDQVELPSRAAARATLGLPVEANILLSLGTLRRDKNLAMIADAVSRAPGWVLVHAGPEGDVSYRELEELGARFQIGDRLLIHRGFIPASEHAGYFAAADLVAACYDRFMTHDSGTAKLVRAYSRPVLATGPTDLENYVSTNGVGYVAPPDDPDAAAKILIRHAALSDPERAELDDHIAEVGRQLSWNAVAGKISDDLGIASQA